MKHGTPHWRCTPKLSRTVHSLVLWQRRYDGTLTSRHRKRRQLFGGWISEKHGWGTFTFVTFSQNSCQFHSHSDSFAPRSSFFLSSFKLIHVIVILINAEDFRTGQWLLYRTVQMGVPATRNWGHCRRPTGEPWKRTDMADAHIYIYIYMCVSSFQFF